MKTRLAALSLALVTLAALGTACDTEPTGTSPAAVRLRDTETIDPPTRPTTGSFTVKGGHDNPFETLMHGYDRAPLEVQQSYLAEVDAQLVPAFTAAFLADERNYEECPWQCDELDMSWDEGVNVQEARFTLDSVVLAEDAMGPHWQSAISAEAQVGCACI